jgi:hypothetical protein
MNRWSKITNEVGTLGMVEDAWPELESARTMST